MFPSRSISILAGLCLTGLAGIAHGDTRYFRAFVPGYITNLGIEYEQFLPETCEEWQETHDVDGRENYGASAETDGTATLDERRWRRRHTPLCPCRSVVGFRTERLVFIARRERHFVQLGSLVVRVSVRNAGCSSDLITVSFNIAVVLSKDAMSVSVASQRCTTALWKRLRSKKIATDFSNLSWLRGLLI